MMESFFCKIITTMQFDRSSIEGIVTKSVLLFALILITAYRYGKSAMHNTTNDMNSYKILSMKFINVHEENEKVFMQLSWKDPVTQETITINHPVEERVWKHQQNHELAVTDQYTLLKDPYIEIRVENNNPENYVIVDERF